MFYVAVTALSFVWVFNYVFGESTPEQARGLFVLFAVICLAVRIGEAVIKFQNEQYERRIEESRAYHRWWRQMKEIDPDLPWGIRPEQIWFSGVGARHRRRSSRKHD